MKTLLLFALLATGCSVSGVPIDENFMPFKGYIAADGARTWSLRFHDEWDRHHAGQGDEDLIAQQMAWSRFCTNGYAIDRVQTVDAGRIYYGTCL